MWAECWADVNGKRITPHMHLRLEQRCGAGGFADVFRISDTEVVKLFRRVQIVEAAIEEPQDHETVIRAVWDAECSAHEIAEFRSDLARHLVPYHGRVIVTDVLDSGGQSRGAEYVLDCGVRLALITGFEEKAGNLEGHTLFPIIDAYLDALNDAGIKAPWDSSVFIPGVGTEFTIIDVGTWEAFAVLSAALADSGRLPDTARKQWSKPFGNSAV